MGKQHQSWQKGAVTVGFRVIEMASCLYTEGIFFQEDVFLTAESLFLGGTATEL